MVIPFREFLKALSGCPYRSPAFDVVKDGGRRRAARRPAPSLVLLVARIENLLGDSFRR